jgi:hypothetical protein
LSTYVLSFSASKDFLEDKLNVSLRAYNVLDSRARRSITETENFIIERDVRRKKDGYLFSPFVFLSCLIKAK